MCAWLPCPVCKESALDGRCPNCCDPTNSTPEEDAFWERVEAEVNMASQKLICMRCGMAHPAGSPHWRSKCIGPHVEHDLRPYHDSSEASLLAASIPEALPEEPKIKWREFL